MNKSSLGRITADDIRRAQAAMNKESGKWVPKDLELVVGDKTKKISTRVTAAEIKEAWRKATRK